MKRKTEEFRDSEGEVAQRQRSTELDSKNTNSWIQPMPIAAQRRYLSITAFQDSLRRKFGLKLNETALKWACGKVNSTIYANNCKIRGKSHVELIQ